MSICQRYRLGSVGVIGVIVVPTVIISIFSAIVPPFKDIYIIHQYSIDCGLIEIV